jgi:hypothetical protein
VTDRAHDQAAVNRAVAEFRRPAHPGQQRRSHP